MVTPLELRNAKREAQVWSGAALLTPSLEQSYHVDRPVTRPEPRPLPAAALPQRSVRLAVNALHSSLDAWKVRHRSL